MLRVSRLLYLAPVSSPLFLSARGSSNSTHKGQGGGGEKRKTHNGDIRTSGEPLKDWKFNIDSFTYDSGEDLLSSLESNPQLSSLRRQRSNTLIETPKKSTAKRKTTTREKVAAVDDDSSKNSDTERGKTVTNRINGYSPQASRSSAADTEGNNENSEEQVTLSNPFRGLHEHISRSYRLDQLVDVATPCDLLLGRQETKSGAFSFMRFESSNEFLKDANISHSDKADGSSDYALTIAQRLLDFPPHMRHFHSLCSRENVPCDFFADVDLPDETPESGERILLEMLNYLDVRLQGIGFLQPSFIILTNEVPSPDKVSYHVHARAMGLSSDLPDESPDESSPAPSRGSKKRPAPVAPRIIAFQDYRAVRLLADEVNQTLGRTVVDEQTYRANGMLRCAFSGKIAAAPAAPAAPAAVHQRGKRLVPLRTARDAALRRRLRLMAEEVDGMSQAEILERSFAARFAPIAARRAKRATEAESKEWLRHFKLIRPRHILGPKSAQAVEFDAYGNAVSPYLTEGAKWRRFKMVVEKLRRLPLHSADSYDRWVRVGLALHNFSNEDHVFEEWVRFSLRCPQKYSREACRKKWQQFERNPDALNWRRGFNYLNTSIWRSVQGG